MKMKFLILLILESFLNNSVLSSNNVNIDKYVLDYIEYIGANMEKIENEDLKLEIEDLFKQFVPGLEQILALENGSKKLRMIQNILLELHNIDLLLNHVKKQDSDEFTKDKKYRIDDHLDGNKAVDKNLLLTIYEELDLKNEDTTNLPPWFPNPNETRKTTKSPYKVKNLLLFLLKHRFRLN